MNIRDRRRKGCPVVGAVWRDAYGNHTVAEHRMLDRARLNVDRLSAAIRADRSVFYI